MIMQHRVVDLESLLHCRCPRQLRSGLNPGSIAATQIRHGTGPRRSSRFIPLVHRTSRHQLIALQLSTRRETVLGTRRINELYSKTARCDSRK